MFINTGTNQSCAINREGHTSPFVANNQGHIYDFSGNFRYASYGFNGGMLIPEIFSVNNGTVARGFVNFDSSVANSIATQNKNYIGSWDVLADPSATGVSSSVFGQINASCVNPGDYVDVISNSASALFYSGGILQYLYSGDLLLCINGINTLIRSDKKSAFMTAMTDVFYLVYRPTGTIPTLQVGRYFNDNLEFSISGSNLVIDDITNPSSPSPMVISSTWNVGSDFLNPGSTIWNLKIDNNLTTTTNAPELVRTSGGMEELGLPF
jgi:hypothetical protein